MTNGDLKTRIEKAATFVRARTRVTPEIGIILGTGLGDFADALAVDAVVPYREIPGFPVSTVESHAGELHLGTLAGRPVAVMKGRVHYYEGYAMQDVAFPVRVLKALGCGTLVITNAVGGMNPNMPAGSLVVTTDHINLMGDNPLIGPNDESLGPRFPDMSEPYTRRLIALAERVALDLEIPLQRAVFVAVAGPNLETAAEYRFLRWIGADVVGMSLVPETIAAVHGGQRVLAFNVVTDTCLPDHLKPVSIPEVLRVAGRVAPTLMRLVTEVVRRLEEVSEARLSSAENR
ncbi:MAG: purine-nucleoside phosphorylase [Candidatus Eisenbacteria bacterium]|uniref:Purine nucleoside phosphorylase n=1 Tax=Eiseniibacteriota bacterium TaxID=2212470 RepID=A0A9D6L3C6_UNCEI|nr:purine-nucleoside phosphorylase [Candidatus Eisenbacteria bacterium]MBI3539022.1 purine-nucleoside phosphorylase [Candidatus Eisenbacteria bacterium]